MWGFVFFVAALVFFGIALVSLKMLAVQSFKNAVTNRKQSKEEKPTKQKQTRLATKISDYQGYREHKIQKQVEKLHVDILNEIARVTINALNTGSSAEDMHIAIKSAVASFQDCFNDEVIKAVVLGSCEEIDKRKQASANAMNVTPIRKRRLA